MYYGVIKNTIKVIHNSENIKEIENNIELLNTNEETEIISKESFNKRVIEENKNTIKQPTEQEIINSQLLKENATQKLINSDLLKQIAELKGGTTNANV